MSTDPKPDAVVRFEDARDSACDIKFRGGDINGCEYDAARFGYEIGSTESPHVLKLMVAIKDMMFCREYHSKCELCDKEASDAIRQFDEIKQSLKAESERRS